MEVKVIKFTQGYGGKFFGPVFSRDSGFLEDRVEKLLGDGWTIAGQSSGADRSVTMTFTRPRKR